MRRQFLALIAAACVAVVGCGDDDAASTGSGSGGSGTGGGPSGSGGAGASGGGGQGGGGQGGGGGIDTTDDVVEIAVRRLNQGQELAAFESARDDFVSLLKMQDGVGTDREFEAFFDFGAMGAPLPPVFIGMTQYATLAAFEAAGQAIGGSAEAGTFFATFQPEAFTPLRPLRQGSPVDLTAIADQPGQVLEVAVRDLSSYANFDAADYAAARDDFLALLTAQPGVVMEYQWVSAADPDIAVGMTVYESQAAFFTVASSDAITMAPETAAFLGGYPPMVGYVNSVVK